VGPLLEQRLYDRDVELSVSQLQLLSDLDTLLNYFELLLYLEDQRRISKRDRAMLFEYWFEVLCDADHAALRRYVAHFGFERVASRLGTDDVDRLMLYGSLMSHTDELADLGLQNRLRYEGPCAISGRLYDLGEYPGLVTADAGNSRVRGELYQVLDPEALETLDRFERFDASDRAGSLYQRRYLQLLEPSRHSRRIDAWVYVYNQKTDGACEIKAGEWKAHQTKTDRES